MILDLINYSLDQPVIDFDIEKVDQKLIKINQEENKFIICINEIRSSGKGRKNPFEKRIQISPRIKRLLIENEADDYKPVLLGYDKDTNTFTFWKFDIYIETNTMQSFYTRSQNLKKAQSEGSRLLFASTSEVYGDPLEHPQNEDYYGNVNTIGPRGVYDEAKRFQESITMAYHRFHGIETRIVRIFNTYGPRMRLNDGRVIPAFIGQALRGEDLTVFGNGLQTRSFCFVDDQVEGIYKLLFSDYSNPVNIGNPHEITIKDFAEEIIKLTQTNQKVVYRPLPKDDPMQRQPDITRAKEILNWEPKVKRSEGMKITYEYFKGLSKEELQKKEHKDFSSHIRK